MEIAARMSSKGQLTVPKAVREALGLGEGDNVLLRVEGNRAVFARTPEFLSLAGTIAVPAAKRNVAWDDVIRTTRNAIPGVDAFSGHGGPGDRAVDRVDTVERIDP